MSEKPRSSSTDSGAKSFQIVVLGLPRGSSPRRAHANLARSLELSLSDARLLSSHLPAVLPRALSQKDARAWCERLAQAGFEIELRESAAGPAAEDSSADAALRCHTHVKHVRSNVCGKCGGALCTLCEALAGGALLCPRCDQARQRSRLFYRVRVAFLLCVLAGVVARGAIDYVRRHERRAWQRPLEVALVLIERGAVDAVALARFRERVAALEQALEAEFSRYGGEFTPIHFRQFGPVHGAPEPPRSEPQPSRLEPLYLGFQLWRFARETDRAAGLGRAPFDGKIYVLLSVPSSERQALVEGLGQDGGRIALTNVELSEDSVDFALFVVAHELFHLLGASDRYDESGLSIMPDGLADPSAVPLYPQLGAEVMARGRVLAPGVEEPPGDLSELRVGRRTAAEIGWLDALGADPKPVR